MSIHTLEDPTCHAVEQLVPDMPSPIVEEDGVLPAFTDVAGVGGRDVPTGDILRVEEVQLLVAQDPDELQFVDCFGAAADPVELRGL